MNPNQVKPPIHVAVQIREPLLQAGACAALRDETGIVMLNDDVELVLGRLDVLVVDASAVPALIQRIAGGAGEYAHLRILVLAANAREHAIRCAFSLGIHGIVLNTSPLDDFIAGVRAVARGDTYLCQALACQLANAEDRELLTPREDDVLQLLAQGLCNKSIGRNLDIATETAKFHVRSIMMKLNAKTRTEVASIAICCGMTEHFSLSLPKAHGMAYSAQQ